MAALACRPFWPCAILAAALMHSGSPAASSVVEPRPFAALAHAVQVTGHPVDPEPTAGIHKRQEAVIARVVAETIAAFGHPRLIDKHPRRSEISLVYADRLIIVTGAYSTRIVCRVEVRPSALKEGASVADMLPLAAQACRNEEVRGWGRAGVTALTPIGRQRFPGPSSFDVWMFATDDIDGLLRDLLRRGEVETGSQALLVRGSSHNEPPSDEGALVWRYAWLANGRFVAAQQDVVLDSHGRRQVGLSCVVETSASPPRLDDGRVFDWCRTQRARLTPGLPAFVEAVRRSAAERAGTGSGVPSIGGGFHAQPVPPELAARFWKTPR